MNQPKYSIEVMSDADWQQMPESGKRLIEILVARIEQLESQYAELNAGDGHLLLAKFIAAFGELGLIGEEIADVIWLALKIQQYEQLFSPTKDSPGESKAEKSDNSSGSPIDSNIPIDPSTPSATSPIPSPSDSPRQVEIHASEEQPSKKSAHASRDLAIRLPDARSLQEPLTLARALRPLLRRVPSANMVLDEAATIERIAEEQLWAPVLKPDLEPWLDLALVVDESKSMLLWQPTIRELQRLLERYGIFRDVRTWGMVIEQVIDKNRQFQGQVRIRPGIGKAARNQRTHSPGELIDPQGRRLVLIATDCIASHWHDGTVLSALKTWSQSGSTAIIQMLPEWLWSRTALGLAAPVRFQALLPALPSQRLKAKPLSTWDEIDFETGIQVPIITLESEIFTVWSQLVAGKGGVWAPGFVFEPELFEPDEEEENGSDNDLPAEQRVRQFYNSASPMAWKLACLLAAAPIINLPVVRIIQDKLLHNKSRQVHVAEVFLGGLLRPLQPLSEITPDTNPDIIRYDFVEGVRAALLESSLRSESVDVLKVVSQFVDSRIGRSIKDFIAYLRDIEQIRDSEIQLSPIATVTTQILKQLGGEYARYAEQFKEEAQTISEIVEKEKIDHAVLMPEVCPYRGLEAFDKQHARFFFGRQKVVKYIQEKLDVTKFVPIIGSSGSGKSSVVRAGLIPQLDDSEWQVLEPIKPGFEPLSELHGAFKQFFQGAKKEKQLKDLIENQTNNLLSILENVPGLTKLLLVVDQFEEVFTYFTSQQERQRFIDLLTQVVEITDSRLAVVIIIRADFLEACLQYSSLTQLIQTQAVFMPLLTGVDLKDTITEPAKLQGHSVEEGLVLKILEDVKQEPGFLPLLEFALTKLWDKRDRNKHQLTLEEYQKLGGLTGALNLHAENVYHYQDYEEEFPTQKRTQQEKEWIGRIFLRLVRVGEGEKDTRQRQPKATLLNIAGNNANQQQELSELLDGEAGLVKGRLLITGKDEKGEAWIDLAHEALIEGWQRFDQWRQQDRDLRRLSERLKDTRQEWLNKSRNENYLMQGGLLAEVRDSWQPLQVYLQSPLEDEDFYKRSDVYEKDRIAKLKRALTEREFDG